MISTAQHSPPKTADPDSLVTRDLFEQVMTPNYAPMDMLPSHGKGSRLWDTNGKEYLDFAGGIAVSAMGHVHPVLVSALVEQANRFWHVSNVLTNQPALELARKLCAATFAERVFLANSGAEVNEAALKLARRYAVDRYSEDKYEILAFDNAFHGRTLFTVSVGGQPAYSSGFGPKPGGISHCPFNDCAAVRDWFEKHQERACAVIMEPCLGEGGVIPATVEFVQTVRECCDKYNALMILDEIQTGVGRSGALYTYQKLGVTPDILTTAKALGCGFPVSAMLTTKDIGSHLVVGTHGSTFGGNPMACAVACAVLDLINTPEILGNVEARSAQLVKGLEKINAKHAVFREIRGVGLLLGCELVEKYAGKAREILKACTESGLLVLVAGADVMRLAPPLNISAEEIDEGLVLLERAVATMLADHAAQQ
jgi:acetylornithine/N-succinyldiaminopimelate aminotransferase